MSEHDGRLADPLRHERAEIGDPAVHGERCGGRAASRSRQVDRKDTKLGVEPLGEAGEEVRAASEAVNSEHGNARARILDVNPGRHAVTGCSRQANTSR